MGRSTWLARKRVSGSTTARISMRIPNTVRIETERLVLRGFTSSDFDDYFALASDPDTFLFSERGPLSSEEAWTRLLRHVGHWGLLGYGLFAVEERESGRFVGEAGLEDFRRQLGADFDRVPEASWSVIRWARGRGYATEAAKAALNWLEQEQTVDRTVCLIHRDNTASLNVARKLGYGVYDGCVYRGYPALLHQRPAGGSSTRRQEP